MTKKKNLYLCLLITTAVEQRQTASTHDKKTFNPET